MVVIFRAFVTDSWALSHEMFESATMFLVQDYFQCHGFSKETDYFLIV